MKRREERCSSWTALGLLTLILFIAIFAEEGAADTEDQVTGSILYISRQVVYIDRGEADGLVLQTELVVFRNGGEIGRLMVDYLAQHSAACTILFVGETALAPGDEIRFIPEPASIEADDQPGPVPEEPPPGIPLRLPPREETFRIRGRTALEWSSFAYAGNSEEYFQQSAFLVRLHGQRLWDRPLEFRLYLRSRYNQRNPAIDSARPRTEWRHRVYRLSLVYDDPDLPFRFALGRMFSSEVPSAGGWDGALVEYRSGSRWRLGVFGGGDPDWIDSEPDFAQQKRGGYVSFGAGQFGHRRYRGTLAFVGQYRSGEVSREFLTVINQVSFGRQLSVHQHLELDLNREWRRETSGEDRTLSRLNADIRYRVNDHLQLNLGYHHYQNVRRIETRDIPDSLFADARLNGLRAGARIRLSRAVRLGGQISSRRRQGEDRSPVFVTGNLGWTDFLHSGAVLECRYAYAEGRFANSRVPSCDLQRNVGNSLRLGLGFGSQSYEGVETETFDLDGQWLRCFGTWRLARSLDLQWIYRKAWGDVAAGDRLFLQLSRRW
ncbi:MAG: hypothetical protein ABIF77_16540 [bacterium]